MSTIVDASSAGEPETDQEQIAARILKRNRLQSIADESIADFLMGISQRRPLDIAVRIVLIAGAIGLLIGAAALNIPSLIGFCALCGTLEAIRANRRIDALVELQGIANSMENEQAGPGNRLADVPLT